MLFAAIVHWSLSLAMFAAAWHFGIRLVDQQDRILQTDIVRQFTVRDLLLLTAEVGLALGLARTTWPQTGIRWQDLDWLMVAVWFVLAFGNALLFNALVTCFHVPRRKWINLGLVVMFAVLISSLQIFAIWKLCNPGDPWQPILLFVSAINTFQLAWLLFALWRLERANVFLRRVFFPKFTRLRWPGEAAG